MATLLFLRLVINGLWVKLGRRMLSWFVKISCLHELLCNSISDLDGGVDLVWSPQVDYVNETS